MTADVGQRLMQMGDRWRRVAHRLGARPLRDDLPAAFRALTADPAAHLADLLESLLPTAEPVAQGRQTQRLARGAPRPVPDPNFAGNSRALGPLGLADRSHAARGPSLPIPPTGVPSARAARGSEPTDRLGARAPRSDGAELGGATADAVPPPGALSETAPELPEARPDRSAFPASRSPGAPALDPVEAPALAGLYRAMAALRLPTSVGDDPSGRRQTFLAGLEWPSEQEDGSFGQPERAFGRGDESFGWRAEPGTPRQRSGASDPSNQAGPERRPAGSKPAPSAGFGDLIRPERAARPQSSAGQRSTRLDHTDVATPPWAGAPGGDPSAGLAGLRLAQGPAGLAALLGANLTTALSADLAADGESEPSPTPPEGIERPAGPPSAVRAQRAGPALPGGGHAPASGLDLTELMEQLADRLEFELLRTYGTLGG